MVEILEEKMTASKNCQCPVCKYKAEVITDGTLWYFKCNSCNTTIGVTMAHLSRATQEDFSILTYRGTWLSAKEAIKAIKEYMR